MEEEKKKNLYTDYLEIAKEWHSTMNGKLTLCMVTSKSNKRVWWKCEKGIDHEWPARVDGRTSGNGCPFLFGKICMC